MTVKELKDMAIDTNVIVRDKATGKIVKNGYDGMEICGIYAKAHRCWNPPSGVVS